MTNLDELYITHPEAGSRTFHIFRKRNDRSLCGRYMMFFRNDEYCDPVADTTTWVKGQDCKACWKAAGLRV